MQRLSRRKFLKGLAGLGLCAAGGLVAWDWLTHAGKNAKAAPASPHVREARYYAGIKENFRCQTCHGTRQPSQVLYCHTPHSGQYVKCQLCPKGCIISDGHRGDCRVRENRGGKLHTVVYGNPCAVNNDPIEKKPFYHFYPGTLAFSIATAGCNLHCLYCQNWTISQFPPEETDNVALMPEQVVELALRNRSRSIAYTYSEPVVFYEYMLEAARLGREVGLKSIVISAGYINPGPLRELCRVVDAIKIDLKGFNENFYQKVCDASLKPVLEAMRVIVEEGVHLEIVNLIVPGPNDDEGELREMCRWIVANLGPDVPTHFSRFYPQYKLTNLPPTPVEKLERAWKIAREEGIHYAYVGNVPGHSADNTYCARCGQLLIVRLGFSVMDNRLTEGKCGYCGNPIPGVWG